MVSTESSSRQYFSALSVLGVVVLVGVPVWWKTTKVYQCPLPYEEIVGLRAQQVTMHLIMIYNNYTVI